MNHAARIYHKPYQSSYTCPRPMACCPKTGVHSCQPRRYRLEPEYKLSIRRLILFPTLQYYRILQLIAQSVLENALTLAASVNRSSISVTDFLFINPSGNLSSLIFIQPSVLSAFSSFTDSDRPGRPGVHLGPARSLNRCVASGVLRGNFDTGA